MADDTYVQEIRYTADIADVQRKLNELSGKQTETENNTKTSTGRMSGHWDTVRESVRKIVVGIGLLGVGAIAMAPKILEGGASLDALDNKAKTVFGGSLPMVNNWAKSSAGAFGMTTSQATSAAAAFADLMKPMGFTAAQAAEMSTKMVGVSGALSAWTGGTQSAAQVSDILSKAMLGQRDGLDQLGIHISDADVKARLAKNGTAGLTGAALEQATALATQQLIMEKSTDAQKAWSDGSMDAVKKQNSTKASIEQVKESFTRALYPALQGILPVITSVADWLGTHLPTAIATLREWISGASQWLGEHKELLIVVAGVIAGVLVGAFVAWAMAAYSAATATLAALSPVALIAAAVAALAVGVIYAYNHFEAFRVTVLAVKDFIVNDLVPAFQAIWRFISDNIIPIISTLIEAYIKVLIVQFNAVKAVITEVLVPAFMAIYNTIVTVGSKVGSVVGEVVGFVTGIPARIADTVNNLWAPIQTGITTAKNWVHDRIEDIFTFATGLPGRMVNIFAGMWDGIKSAFRSAINAIIDFWNGLDFTIPKVHIWGVGDVGGGTIGFPDLPRFHSGGGVPGLNGEEVMAILQGGETVLTRAQVSQIQMALAASASGVAGAGKAITINGGLHVSNPTGTTGRFAQELWRVAG